MQPNALCTSFRVQIQQDEHLTYRWKERSRMPEPSCGASRSDGRAMADWETRLESGAGLGIVFRERLHLGIQSCMRLSPLPAAPFLQIWKLHVDSTLRDNVEHRPTLDKAVHDSPGTLRCADILPIASKQRKHTPAIAYSNTPPIADCILAKRTDPELSVARAYGGNKRQEDGGVVRDAMFGYEELERAVEELEERSMQADWILGT
ncbi:uncharacterized protein EV420DRAFT_1748414 [Desarmillaria tabescens]|uniref:Uncharacterized protein n=1 Tax=Armillaria tabescens TaxID=1929756 RepID=A0AA39KE49_ARMTA|nr:uncharacterized protein EV420DRAFT_1748414 [Desarmillaria tabescens]KAK0458124.1 hypothetical protein EV420DRAFT_1748414 [Desarmillaria tabescens]